jgi:hypothetical protein
MRSRLTIALMVVALGATFFETSAGAQMRAMIRSGAGARLRVGPRLGMRRGFIGAPYRQPFSGPVLLPPYYYSDYFGGGYEPIATQAPVPPVPAQLIVMQSAPPPVAPASPAESVVLENQGGQWVRTSGQTPRAQSPQPDASARLQSAPAVTKEVPAVTKPSPAVLVFRDGHTEEVERYMIKGDVIFTDANYWSTGSWTKRVPIAQLDLPATQKANEQRGGKFSLPSGPNEVMIR